MYIYMSKYIYRGTFFRFTHFTSPCLKQSHVIYTVSFLLLLGYCALLSPGRDLKKNNA